MKLVKKYLNISNNRLINGTSLEKSLEKSLTESEFKTSFNSIKKAMIDPYLEVDQVLANAKPSLERDMSTALYDYTILLIRSFFRIFDYLHFYPVLKKQRRNVPMRKYEKNMLF